MKIEKITFEELLSFYSMDDTRKYEEYVDSLIDSFLNYYYKQNENENEYSNHRKLAKKEITHDHNLLADKSLLLHLSYIVFLLIIVFTTLNSIFSTNWTKIFNILGFLGLGTGVFTYLEIVENINENFNEKILYRIKKFSIKVIYLLGVGIVGIIFLLIFAEKNNGYQFCLYYLIMYVFIFFMANYNVKNQIKFYENWIKDKNLLENPFWKKFGSEKLKYMQFLLLPIEDEKLNKVREYIKGLGEPTFYQ